MDCAMPQANNLTQPRPADLAELVLLPSREAAYSALVEALDHPLGPIVLTGDAGMGKSWLLRKIAAEQAVPWHWVNIEVVPSEEPEKLDRKICHTLGLEKTDRFAWLDFLAERGRNGERWGLVLDEAHNLTQPMLEEVRVLSAPGSLSGFGAVILAGQTSLARRLATPSLRPFASRIASFAHIGPIDADDAQILLDAASMDTEWDLEVVEALHRDSGGEPRLLIQLGRRFLASQRPRPAALPMGEATTPRISLGVESREIPPAAAEMRRDGASRPILGPSRPPLRVEDGLIEVGWSPDLEESESPEESSGRSTMDEGQVAADRIDDQTAALKAWGDWAREQGRHGHEIREDASGVGQVSAEAVPRPARDIPRSSPLDEFPDVWAEPQQEFAPLGQLFASRRVAEDLEEES